MLVVGPSGVFMRYIERVLPSLGETAVALRSLGEVVDGIRAARHDEPAVADVKGAARMAELMRRTARQAVPDAPREFRVFYRDDNIVLGGRDLNQLRRQLLSQGKRNRQLPRVASTLIDAMWRQVTGERGRARGKEEFTDTMLGNPAFVEFALHWWPALDATDVLRWLRDPELLVRVGEGVVSPADQELLAASWQGRDDWSVEDVALLDELRYLLGDLPEKNDHEPDPLAHLVDENMPELTTITDREFSRGPRTTTRTEDDCYAHVLVDEAQDLTPMQWRMVGRRGRTATWTIVGDPAQSSWPVPADATAARDEAIGDKARHEFHLSTNYRNSKEIYDFAAGYASRVGLDADLPNAVRATGIGPEERPYDGPGGRRARRGHRARRRGRGHGRDRGAGGPASRSRDGWPPGRSTPRPRPAAPTRGSRCSPAWTPRAWSSTGSWSWRRRRSRTSPRPAGPRSTWCSPGPPSGWSPSPRADVLVCRGGAASPTGARARAGQPGGPWHRPAPDRTSRAAARPPGASWSTPRGSRRGRRSRRWSAGPPGCRAAATVPK